MVIVYGRNENVFGGLKTTKPFAISLTNESIDGVYPVKFISKTSNSQFTELTFIDHFFESSGEITIKLYMQLE